MTASNAVRRNAQIGRLVALASAAALLALVVRVAWVADDAYITLRTVDNWVHGFGLRWNVAERVQSYTHPLWLLALSAGYVFTREAWLTTIALSAAVTTGMAWTVLRLLPSPRAAMVFAALGTSSAFRDFSTSGLENPLAHLVVALTAVATTRKARAETIGLLLAAAALTRPDLVLLVLPIAARHLLDGPSVGRLARGLAGAIPLAAWVAFSVAYYGLPIPNTALAKLATGIPGSELRPQGWAYLYDSLTHDAPTLALIAVAVLAALRAGWDARLWALGILLYLAYVVQVGGDFMSGRFLTAPLVASAILLGQHRRGVALLAVAPLALVLAMPFGVATFPGDIPGREFRRPDVRASGIVDERQYYANETGLFGPEGIRSAPDLRPWAQAGRWSREGIRVRTLKMAGFAGYLAGPDVHLVDVMALADPLLARLPARRPWRVGHYERDVPAGYLDTLRTGKNVIEDPAVSRLWTRVELITRAPIWSTTRWQAMRAVGVSGRSE